MLRVGVMVWAAAAPVPGILDAVKPSGKITGAEAAVVISNNQAPYAWAEPTGATASRLILHVPKL